MCLFIQSQAKIDGAEMIDDKLIVKFYLTSENMFSLAWRDVDADNRKKVFEKHGNVLNEIKVFGRTLPNI